MKPLDAFHCEPKAGRGDKVGRKPAHIVALANTVDRFFINCSHHLLRIPVELVDVSIAASINSIYTKLLFAVVRRN